MLYVMKNVQSSVGLFATIQPFGNIWIAMLQYLLHWKAKQNT